MSFQFFTNGTLEIKGFISRFSDETSFKRGQNHVTVVADTKAKRIIDVEEGRDGETVDLFSKQLENHGGDCNQIKYVTSDMSAAYGCGIQ
ncbi:MAG: transposase, partial [Clostridia bacterium]